MADELYEFEVRVDASQGEQQFRRLADSEDDAKRAAAAFQAELQGLGTQLKRLETNTTNYSRKQIQALNAQEAAERKAQQAMARRLELEKKNNTKAADAEKVRSLRAVVAAEREAEAVERKRIAGLRQQERQVRQTSVAMEQYTKTLQSTGGEWGQDVSAEQERIQGLANTRYALYDAAQAYTFLAGALVAPGVASVKFAADYEKAFSSVRRTTLAVGPELAELREDLIGLSTDMPTSFQSLSEIATIGAQLGVATDNLGKFTDVVAMFSATTNVSIDAASVGLGRLAQLTKTSGTMYENLASSIYQVGITSVATEGEILDMAAEIATSGNLAGLANHEIVALAGSLASLGVQPEAARGSLMRIFNIIETGATSGGAALSKLAAVSGMSAEDIKRDWGTDSQKVFSSFVQGLSDIQSQGGNTNKVLKDMGINAIRDIRTLQILANNTDVYNSLLVESNQAYGSGDSLRRGFAIQMENLIDKLAIFGNIMKAIGDEVGSGALTWLNPLVDGFTQLAEVLLMLAKTPIGGFILAAGLAIAGAVGTVLAFRAAMMLAQASVAALTTSLVGLRTGGGVLTVGLKGLVTEFIALTGHIRAATVATAENTAAAVFSIGSLGDQAEAMNEVEAGAGRAAMGLKLLRIAGAGILIGASLFVLPEILNAIGEAFESNTAKAERFFGSLNSLENSIQQDTDTYRKTGEAIRTVTTSVEEATQVTPEWVNVVDAASGGQVNLNNAVKDSTTNIKDQTIAIGAATKATVANMYAQDKNFAQLYANNKAILTEAGFNMQTLLERTLKGTGDAYLRELQAKVEQLGRLKAAPNANLNELNPDQNMYQDLIAQIGQYSGAVDGVNSKVQELANKNLILADSNTLVGNSAAAAAGGLTGEAQTATDLLNSLSGILSGNLATAQSYQTLADSMLENGNAFDTYSAKGIDNMQALQGVISGMAQRAGEDTQAFGEDVAGMFQYLQDQGADMSGELSFLGETLNATLGQQYGLDFTTVDARTNLRAYIQDAISTVQANMAIEQSALNAALAMGDFATAGAIAGRQNAEALKIAALQGLLANLNSQAAAASAAASRAANAAAASHKKAAKATQTHAKRVRTLTDYMNDLSSVMKNAFDFRFGLDQAMRGLREVQKEVKDTKTSFEAMQEVFDTRLSAFDVGNGQDSITGSVRSMAESFEDAADRVTDAVQQILDAQATLAQNAANQKVATFQLGVAEQYGDELRAAQLRAKIADLEAESVKNQQDLTKAQKNLAVAQDATNKTLVGNSDAAIRNRKDVQALLTEYIDYIKAVKESGATQEQISGTLSDARKDFLRQAAALGFNVTELESYANILSPVTAAQIGQTEAAGDAQQQMEDLTEAWQKYILELVESGASQKQVNDAIRQAKADLANQAIALGLSAAQAKKYQDSMSDLAKVLKEIPKKLTMDADLSPAERALKEWRAKNTNGKGASAPITISTDVDTGALKKAARGRALLAEIDEAFINVSKALGRNDLNGAVKWRKTALALQGKLIRGDYSGGGFTGRGGKYDEAGTVHRGEYVIPKQHVNQNTGLPYMDAFSRIARGYSGGGPVGGTASNTKFPGSMLVELSPTDRALLAAAGHVTMTLDGKVVTETVNRNNRNGGVRRG